MQASLEVNRQMRVIYFLLVQSLVLFGVGAFATPHMFVATFAYLLMVNGLVHRKNKKLHVKLMNSAIGLDLALVLLLELSRNAVDTALSFSLSPLQQAHIVASSLATALYIPILILGWLRYTEKLKGSASRSWHLRLGVVAFIFRSLGFLFMFSLLVKNG